MYILSAARLCSYNSEGCYFLLCCSLTDQLIILFLCFRTIYEAALVSLREHFQPILEDIFPECVTDGVSNFTPFLIIYVSL